MDTKQEYVATHARALKDALVTLERKRLNDKNGLKAGQEGFLSLDLTIDKSVFEALKDTEIYAMAEKLLAEERYNNDNRVGG